MSMEYSVLIEKERSLLIVNHVSNLRIGGKFEPFPSPFVAGYQLACEEVQQRLRYEQGIKVRKCTECAECVKLEKEAVK